jgi:hypothetical protein
MNTDSTLMRVLDWIGEHEGIYYFTLIALLVFLLRSRITIGKGDKKVKIQPEE